MSQDDDERYISYESLVSILYIMNRTFDRLTEFTICNWVCIVEEHLFDQNMIGPTYVMTRTVSNAHNDKLVDHIKSLAGNGFLSKDSCAFSKNERTDKFLEGIKELLQEFDTIFKEIDVVMDKHKDKNVIELARLVPKSRMLTNNNIPIRLGQIIIDPCSLKDTSEDVVEFYMDEDWYDSVEVLLDPKIMASLKKSMDDLKKGRVIVRTRK